MQTYTCPSCKSYFTEADKQWDFAIGFGKCPECLKPLRDFPVPMKPHAPQPKTQEERPATPKQYPWGAVLIWTLSAFLFGLTQPLSHMDEFLQTGFRVFSAIAYAICTAVTVGTYKYFKRDSWRLFGATVDAPSADRALFWFSATAAIVFLVKALYLQRHIGLVDAGLCGFLGVGVRYGVALSRWLLAVYAFLSPTIVVLSTGSRSGEIWPFLFFVACRSIILRRNKSQLDPVYGVSAEKMSQVEISKMTAATQPTKPLASVSIPTESSQQTIEMLGNRLYEQIAQELETNTVDRDLWTKAYAQAGGDDKQTRVLYIKARFARLLAIEDV